MGWKEFLKPDWRKIIYSIALYAFFLLGVTGLSQASFGIVLDSIVFIAFLLSIPAWLISFPLSPITNALKWYPSLLNAFIFGNAIHSYLFSCLLIHFWKKSRILEKIKKYLFIK